MCGETMFYWTFTIPIPEADEDTSKAADAE